MSERILTNAQSAQSNDVRALSATEIDAVGGGRDYNLGFGIHLFVMGDYYLVYTDAKGPVIST